MPLAAESGIFPGKFWRNEFFLLYLQSRNESSGIFAEIAQLVERNLAKVEVAGPSPVFRSETFERKGNKKKETLCINDM